MSRHSLAYLCLSFGFMLSGCDSASFSDEIVSTPGIRETTIKSSGASENATLSIPRYKIYQHLRSPNRLWVALGSSDGSDTFYSEDGGETWRTLASTGWEYHMSLAGDESGRVHFIDRGKPAAKYYRLINGEIEQRSSFADYGRATTSGNVAAVGSEVVVFTRNRDDDRDPVHYHRSTDAGETWHAGEVKGTGNANGLRHRIGSVVIDGQITLAYWKAGGAPTGDTVTLFRWDGDEFARLESEFTTSTRSDWTRQYAITQDAAGTVHLVIWDRVDGRRVLLHSTRTLDSAWSPAETVVEWEADDIHAQLSACGNGVAMVYLYNSRSTDPEDALPYFRAWNAEDGWGEGLVLSSTGGARYPIAPQIVAPESPFIPIVWVVKDSVRFVALPMAHCR